MAIPESQLDTWAKQGSVAQSAQTYGTIKAALEDRRGGYNEEDYSIFLQGSYGNDTNVFADSDVDIVMRLNSVFYKDITRLNESETASYNSAYSNATYGLHDFKRDVVAQLTAKYGGDVTVGKKAIDIKGTSNRRNADVLVCAKYRRYYSFSSSNRNNYVEGICFFPTSGGMIENYPETHSANCTKKHQATSSWFKPTVRIFKNARNKMTSENKLKYGSAPSYFLEGMLYNVPSTKFGKSYGDTVANCINWLVNEADRSELVCVSELHYLLRNGSPVTWNESEFSAFLSAISDLWNQW